MSYCNVSRSTMMSGSKDGQSSATDTESRLNALATITKRRIEKRKERRAKLNDTGVTLQGIPVPRDEVRMVADTVLRHVQLATISRRHIDTMHEKARLQTLRQGVRLRGGL